VFNAATPIAKLRSVPPSELRTHFRHCSRPASHIGTDLFLCSGISLRTHLYEELCERIDHITRGLLIWEI
jgi:hypothetical protein